MGAYDNPQAVRMKIDQGARNIAQFFTAMKGVSENIQRQAAINKKEAQKATLKKEREEEKAKREEKATDARTGRVVSGFDKTYANIEALAEEIGNPEVKGANLQDDSIMENLIAMRTDFLSKISDPDIGAAEISKIQAQYNNKIATFKKDIDNFVGGYRVYEEIKSKNLNPNDEDAILTHGEFNEMIPIYESLRTGKGNVGIYPSEDGKSFVVGQFNRTGKKSMSGVDEFEKSPSIASSLTKYRQYAQKDPKNPKFFEQVEIFSPEGSKSRKDFLDQGIKRFDNSQYNFGVRKPVMVKNEKGEEVPKMYVSGQMKGTQVMGDVVLDEEKFRDFTKTREGIAFLLEGIQGQDPESVWVGLGNDPIANPFSKEGLIEGLTENLITTYNKPTL